MRTPFMLLATVLTALALGVTAHAQSAGTLRGAVVDNCGRAIAGSELRLLDEPRSATSAASGRFALAGLPPGRYDAELVTTGFATQLVRFEISTGRITDLGLLVVGTANEGSCNYIGHYRDVATVRALAIDGAGNVTDAGIAYRTTKECPGGCE